MCDDAHVSNAPHPLSLLDSPPHSTSSAPAFFISPPHHSIQNNNNPTQYTLKHINCEDEHGVPHEVAFPFPSPSFLPHPVPHISPTSFWLHSNLLTSPQQQQTQGQTHNMQQQDNVQHMQDEQGHNHHHLLPNLPTLPFLVPPSSSSMHIDPSTPFYTGGGGGDTVAAGGIMNNTHHDTSSYHPMHDDSTTTTPMIDGNLLQYCKEEKEQIELMNIDHTIHNNNNNHNNNHAALLVSPNASHLLPSPSTARSPSPQKRRRLSVPSLPTLMTGGGIQTRGGGRNREGKKQVKEQYDEEEDEAYNDDDNEDDAEEDEEDVYDGEYDENHEEEEEYEEEKSSNTQHDTNGNNNNNSKKRKNRIKSVHNSFGCASDFTEQNEKEKQELREKYQRGELQFTLSVGPGSTTFYYNSLPIVWRKAQKQRTSNHYLIPQYFYIYPRFDDIDSIYLCVDTLKIQLYRASAINVKLHHLGNYVLTNVEQNQLFQAIQGKNVVMESKNGKKCLKQRQRVPEEVVGGSDIQRIHWIMKQSYKQQQDIERAFSSSTNVSQQQLLSGSNNNYCNCDTACIHTPLHTLITHLAQLHNNIVEHQHGNNNHNHNNTLPPLPTTPHHSTTQPNLTPKCIYDRILHDINEFLTLYKSHKSQVVSKLQTSKKIKKYVNNTSTSSSSTSSSFYSPASRAHKSLAK